MSAVKLTLILFAAVLMLFAAISTRAADQLTFTSDEAAATLIELFTSEGCRSCPPAEASLSQLKTRADLWKKIMPAVFHVDYWDGLGWPDRFAKPEFTQRQRRYAFSWPTGAVYTPMFVVNGKEWHGWFNGEASPRRSEKAGALSVTLTGETEVTATFIGAKQRSLKLEVALLGSNLDSDVKRGENRGRRLRHDFDVLQFTGSDMVAGGDRWRGTTSFPKGPQITKPSALVAWVRQDETDPPIQATGGWLRP
jgi:hypothetical protein